MANDTILILDNDKHITWTMKTLLETEEYPVVVADTLERATKNFSEFQVSGFITEYYIDGGSTLDAIRKLKEMFPETYVMMITNREMKEDEYEEMMRNGVDDYFLKPIPIKKILFHLRKGLKYRNLMIERNRLERELVVLDSKDKGAGASTGAETSLSLSSR